MLLSWLYLASSGLLFWFVLRAGLWLLWLRPFNSATDAEPGITIRTKSTLYRAIAGSALPCSVGLRRAQASHGMAEPRFAIIDVAWHGRA